MDDPTTRLTPPPGSAGPPEPARSFDVRAVEPSPGEDRGDRRRLLWRDSATILIVVVLTVLAGQILLPPAEGPAASQPVQSGVVVGSLPPGFSLPPGVTFGPIVDPSIGIDRTPTPIPAITDFPTPTPKITPRPTPRVTPRPTAKASVKPSTSPVTPAPTGTPPPPPTIVSLTCTVPTFSFTVTCDSVSANIEAGSQQWAMGGAGTFVVGGNGSASIEYQYSSTLPATYTIELSVTGLDGTTTDTAMDSVTVPGV